MIKMSPAMETAYAILRERWTRGERSACGVPVATLRALVSRGLITLGAPVESVEYYRGGLFGRGGSRRRSSFAPVLTDVKDAK